MNTIKKHINILLLGCCSLNFISCTDLTEEIFSDITEDSYKYEAGDATKVVGAAYTNLQDWGYCGSGQAPMLSQEICTDAAVWLHASQVSLCFNPSAVTEYLPYVHRLRLSASP